MTESPRDAFIRASQWHGSLAECAAILAAHPEITDDDIHVAAILGDDARITRLIGEDPAKAITPGGPFNREPLTHLCFSRYLRLEPDRGPGFVRGAEALIRAGANPAGGFSDERHKPNPCLESNLYGAAGVAHHAGVTRVLVEHGADPNDAPAFEVPYHAPETDDNRALAVLVETGKLTPWSLNMMLVRKADWHDEDGLRYLLEHGADPELERERGMMVLPQALERDNDLSMIRLLLDHGAQPTGRRNDLSAWVIAARRGRGDVLRLFQEQGFTPDLQGVDALLAACALHDEPAIASWRSQPDVMAQLQAQGGQRMIEFAGTNNAGGLERLLSLGIAVDARSATGDSYWSVAPDSTALHSAAWRAQHDAVTLLLARGADPNATDSRGDTPLLLAVRAATSSYWAWRRKPRSIEALLLAGADPARVTLPTGFPEADLLLRARA